MNRIFKKFLYGSAFLSLLGITILGIYYFFMHSEPTCFDNLQNQTETGIDCGGPCILCEIKNINSEDFEKDVEVQIIQAGEGQIALFTKVKNPSNIYGAEFNYKFSIFNKLGGESVQISGKSFVDTEETRYITVPLVKIDKRDVQNVDFSVLDFKWDFENTHPDYSADINEVSTVLENGEIKINGIFKNTSSNSIAQVRITSFITDNENSIICASASELRKVGAFSENKFTVFCPKTTLTEEEIGNSETEIFWESIE
jgi:hypothetical protein